MIHRLIKFFPSPVLPELQFQAALVDGVEVPAWVPAVYPVFPSYDNFTTEAMLKAGVDPGSISINTQTSDRLDASGQVAAFASEAELIINDPVE